MERDQIFTIKFTKGLASRHRLPLGHVIETLREVADMIREIGKNIQREQGVEKPTGDFGIELLAGRDGIAFREGSLFANAAITRDVENGLAALHQVFGAVDHLRKRQPEKIVDGRTVVRGLSRIAQIQRMDQTVLTMRLRATPTQRTRAAQMDEVALRVLEKMDSEAISVEGVTVYGRLRQLTDRALGDSPESMRMWGELLADGGEKWRVKFTPQQYQQALRLFAKQVEIRGTATYYQTSSPRLVAGQLVADEPRDYLAIFDELVGTERETFGEESTQDLVAEARGR